MTINSEMNLDDLASRMSSTEPVSREDAEKMRAILVVQFDGWDTANVPEVAWNRILGFI